MNLFFKMLTFKKHNSYIPSLEEECESSLCTAALRARNMDLHRDMKRLTAVFEKLHTYVSLLALPSKFLALLVTFLTGRCSFPLRSV